MFVTVFVPLIVVCAPGAVVAGGVVGTGVLVGTGVFVADAGFVGVAELVSPPPPAFSPERSPLIVSSSTATAFGDVSGSYVATSKNFAAPFANESTASQASASNNS